MKKTIRYFLALSSLLIAPIVLAANTVSLEKELEALEVSSGGRIGIYALDTANSKDLQYHASERFPTGCTSKVLAVAAVLDKAKTDKSLLTQNLLYSKSDLVTWSPITEKFSSTGMSVEDLCAASISYSDNTAMNLLVKKLGGLDQITKFAKSIGNESFRQDSGWPEEAFSGGKTNLKDSSTPKDMALSLQKLAFTEVLAKPQREMLMAWMKANTTGPKRIRAAVPEYWRVADKTGTGAAYGTTNDLAVIWPPKCAPLIVAVYYTSDDKNAKKREDIVAKATKLIISKFAETDSCVKSTMK